MELKDAVEFIQVDETSPTGGVWSRDFNHHKKGKVFGYLNSRKTYWRQKINNIEYAVHTLIWIKINGEIPEGKTVDHRDNNGLNNREYNLRLASSLQQLQNRRPWGCCKFRGVSKTKNTNYVAYIMYPEYGRVHLGYYKLAEHAAIAHDIAAAILFPYNTHYKINFSNAFWLTAETRISNKVLEKLETFFKAVSYDAGTTTQILCPKHD